MRLGPLGVGFHILPHFLRLGLDRFLPFGGRVGVLFVMFHLRLFAGLDVIDRGAFGWISTVLFLLVKDFLIVSDVSWIGHRTHESPPLRHLGVRNETFAVQRRYTQAAPTLRSEVHESNFRGASGTECRHPAFQQHLMILESIRRSLFLCALALLSACASKPIASFHTGRPLFAPEIFFAGRTHSWGVFETRDGKPASILRTTTEGHVAADGFHFEQDLDFESGRKSHRSWLVRRLDAHRYSATGTGIVGEARGLAHGNAFHLEFTLDAFPGNPLGHLHMSQWMYLQPDGTTMLNRATLSKAGIIVAQVTEQFQKDRAAVTPVRK